MNNRKILLLLTAQNNAGKTSVATGLSQEGYEHYSMRKTIGASFARVHGRPYQTREDLSAFSTAHKKAYGGHIFLQEAYDEFLKSSKQYGVVESIRCTGEVAWREKISTTSPILLPIVGIRADLSIRFERWKQREDKFAGDNTFEQFMREEQLSNSGTDLWSENISSVMDHAQFIADNSNTLMETVLSIKAFVAEQLSYVAPVASCY
jgi:hypothetical protein